MKCVYRGCEIEVKREKCMAGYPLVYYSAYGVNGGDCLFDSFEDTEDKVQTIMKYLKNRIDKELQETMVTECP